MSILVKLGKCGTSAALLATTVSLASVQANDGDFLKCQSIEKDSARLACYDAAARQITAKPQQADAAPDLTATKQKLEQEIAQLKRQKEALGDAERSRKDSGDTSYEGLSATVVKVARLRDGKLRLYLNNNQIWDQSDSKFVRGIKEGVVVEMSEGVWGAVFIRAQDRKNGGKFRRVK